MKSLNRPYIICHMTTSIDGKVTGNFLSHPAIDVYYQINRDYKADAYDYARKLLWSDSTRFIRI